ncbi:hypothetical protein ACH4FX_40760 [Streptomyces sp. NPDC018019]|uniref:hypothetical protein n=1 Tax=Streptomyces sp. NPDC018019 TaxID=3365030 RepID=UPI0037AC4E08
MGEVFQGHAGQQDAETVSAQPPVDGDAVDDDRVSGVGERLPQVMAQVTEGEAEEGIADGDKSLLRVSIGSTHRLVSIRWS